IIDNYSFDIILYNINSTKMKEHAMILNVADRIRYMREKLGMTQTDLANKLGISRSAVNAWEMSLSFPSLSNIVEMARIFHVTTDYLLSFIDRITVDITDLGNEEREVIIKTVNCLQSKNSLSK
ncbi:MAG: helix-turn-helix transcriptional regulator, partial [Clostridia bacterium]|nr:helix-turn-helix transcriptional regulator [Clostridia bacterium]